MILQSVVAIFCGAGSIGTGVVVSDTQIVTANHVTDRNRCTVAGNLRLTPDAAHPEHDVSVMGYHTTTLDAPAPISCARMQAGETYQAVGRAGRYSLRARGTYATTVVEDQRLAHMASMDGSVPVGASGGPVVTQDGQVIAIVSSGTEERTYVKELADTPLCPA